MEIDRQKIPFESSLWAFLTSTFSFVLNSVSVRDPCCLFLVLIFIIFIHLLSCHHPPNVFASCNSTVRQSELTYGADLLGRSDPLSHPSDSSGIPVGLCLCLANLLMEVKPLLEKPLRAQQVQKNELPLSLRIRSSALVPVLQCHHIRPLFFQAFELGQNGSWINSSICGVMAGFSILASTFGLMLITVTRETRVILAVVHSGYFKFIHTTIAQHCCSAAPFPFILDDARAFKC